MPDPLMIGLGLGVFNTVLGGLTGLMQDATRSKQQRAQARQLRKNVSQIRDLVQKGEKSLDEAFVIFDNMLKSQKSEVTRLTENYRDQAVLLQQEAFSRSLSNLDRQLETAKKDMSYEEQRRAERLQEQARQYRMAVREQQKQVLGSLSGARLLESRFGTKTAERLQKQLTEGEKAISEERERTAQDVINKLLGLEEEVAYRKEELGRAHEAGLGRTQQQFADLLSERLLGIEEKRATGKIGLAEQKLGLQMGAEQQIMQLQNMISGLETASKGLPTSFLQGIMPGLGQIGGAFAQKGYSDYYIDEMDKLLSKYQYPQQVATGAETLTGYEYGGVGGFEGLLGG